MITSKYDFKSNKKEHPQWVLNKQPFLIPFITPIKCPYSVDTFVTAAYVFVTAQFLQINI